MLEVATTHPEQVVLVLAALIEEDPPLTSSFATELASRLQGRGPAMVFPLSWLDQRLAAKGEALEHVFELASQSQAADQVTIGNSIGSLRLLSATDWRQFVEAMSVVEQTLRGDPGGVYHAMEFSTRDKYRHAVESIAKRSSISEDEVARAAIRLARDADAARTRHVGYFLIDEGRATLERATRARRPMALRFRALGRRHRFAIYAGSITVLAALATVFALRVVPPATGWQLAAWASVLAIGASQLAIVHWATSLLIAPKLLPRLDFAKGIPVQHRTLVAIPTLLTDAAEVDELVESLEVHFLANRGPNLAFALVTDLRDAPTETAEADRELVARARSAIEALNAKYAPAEGEGFFLFHRARKRDARENVWMGWERKRGKLEELNAALRGELARFEVVVGNTAGLERVKYVIALDSDTQLPRDAARLLAATLAHPLNRPCYDERLCRVSDGYAILQPRVGASMSSIARSRFARWFGGEPGIDPYTRAVSDVYQDVFEEGSFIGKGIYDVDAVRQALHERLPENRILSHDLLEGAYARSGLVTDVLLIEDFPSVHAVDVSRRHRWIRGDWQIATWLLRRVPGPSGRASNPIAIISQWKVFDNLRRSLVPIAMLALLVLGWLRAPPGSRRSPCARSRRARGLTLAAGLADVPTIDRAARTCATSATGSHASSAAPCSRSPACPTTRGSRSTRSDGRCSGWW